MTRREICQRVRDAAVKEYHSNDLDLKCGICSVVIAELFLAFGYPVKICYGKFHRPGISWGLGHCWVESQGRIYDVTATQFGDFDAVLIKRKRGLEKMYVPETILDPKDKEKLRDFFNDWPSDQRPTRRVVELLRAA
jgi:hypothetical protein